MSNQSDDGGQPCSVLELYYNVFSVLLVSMIRAMGLKYILSFKSIYIFLYITGFFHELLIFLRYSFSLLLDSFLKYFI